LPLSRGATRRTGQRHVRCLLLTSDRSNSQNALPEHIPRVAILPQESR
jgi:hypothetical protein